MNGLKEDVLIETGPQASAWSEWTPFFWFAALLLGSYAVVLWKLAQQWVSDPDMTHGPFVPFLVGYIVWERRVQLAALKPIHNVSGIVLMLIGAALLCIGPPGLDTFAVVTRIAFAFSLIGTIVYLRGWKTVRLLLYPLALLMLMFPMPGYVMEKLTFPLQIIASQLAERILELSSYSVLREGNILILPGQTLNIAEACSGLRSMLALTFLGQSYAYLFDSRAWMRLVIAILVVPIAVVANSLRIVATAIAGSYNRAWGEGMYHESTGWIVFVVAFFCIVISHLILKAILRTAKAR
jgi:exosortase